MVRTGDVDPMAMHDIEAAIHELMEKANEQVRDLAQQARAAATAEHLLKVSRAKLMLRSEGRSAEQREAWVLTQMAPDDGSGDEVSMADLDWAYRESAAIKEATVERGRMIRAQLDAMRTLASNVRQAVTHASGMGG